MSHSKIPMSPTRKHAQIYSEQNQNEIEQLHGNIDEVKQQMTYSIQNALNNGDNIDYLHERAHQLSQSANTFHRNARKNRQQACCNNYRCYIIIGIGASIFYLLAAISCQNWNVFSC